MIVALQLSCSWAQSVSPATAPNDGGLPKPVANPTAGTWRYRATDAIPSGTYHSTFSITIKDEGPAWVVDTTMEFPDGPVTDVSTLEKGTLILRKELFKHFPKPGQPWKTVMMKLDFTASKVTGVSTNAKG